jgi:hypothetical protein
MTAEKAGERSITIREFKRAIRKIPRDEKIYNPDKWYLTQKEHWLGWLSQYKTAGAYGRQTGVDRDARYAYNHIVEPKLLLYLIHAIPLDQTYLDAAERAHQTSGKTMMAKSGAIRKAVPWSVIYQALWG